MTSLSELQRIAATYPAEAAHTPADERDRYFSDAQRRAWEMRFRPEVEQQSTVMGSGMAKNQDLNSIQRFDTHKYTNLEPKHG